MKGIPNIARRSRLIVTPSILMILSLRLLPVSYGLSNRGSYKIGSMQRRKVRAHLRTTYIAKHMRAMIRN